MLSHSCPISSFLFIYLGEGKYVASLKTVNVFKDATDVWACAAAAGGRPCPQGPFLWEPAVVEAGTRQAAAHMA